MWKQYLFFAIFILVFVRFLGTTESKLQSESTRQMDARCLQVKRSPIHVVLQGTSEGIAHTLFEMTQKAECPRKIVFTILECPSSDETAAVLYQRAVRMRGNYDSSFEDQFSWLRSLDKDFRIVGRIRDILDTIGEPLVLTVFAEMQQTWTESWDSHLWNSLPKMKNDHSIFTVVPNAFSRLKPAKKIQVEWMPLHMDHRGHLLEVVFPSQALFGSKIAMNQIFTQLAHEWPQMPWKCWSLVASYMNFQFTGIILLESPSKFVQDIDSWNPKIESAVYKELLSKQPSLEDNFFERQSLGLDTDSASNLEIILKQGSIKELHRNMHHVRSKDLS